MGKFNGSIALLVYERWLLKALEFNELFQLVGKLGGVLIILTYFLWNLIKSNKGERIPDI